MVNRNPCLKVSRFQINRIQGTSGNFLHILLSLPALLALFCLLLSLLCIPILAPTSQGTPHLPPASPICPNLEINKQKEQTYNKKSTRLRDGRSWNGNPICFLLYELGQTISPLWASFLTYKIRMIAPGFSWWLLDWMRWAKTTVYSLTQRLALTVLFPFPFSPGAWWSPYPSSWGSTTPATMWPGQWLLVFLGDRLSGSQGKAGATDLECPPPNPPLLHS